MLHWYIIMINWYIIIINYIIMIIIHGKISQLNYGNHIVSPEKEIGIA